MNRLTKADHNGNNVHLIYYYDGLNRQIARDLTAGASAMVRTFYNWDGWNLIEERDNASQVKNVYLHGARTDEIVARFLGGNPTRWYHYDGRGNASHLTDDSGSVVERYTYDLAGKPSFFNGSGQQVAESPSNNRFLFTGRDYQKETGLYDYRNRFYHPGLGRFMQSDPLGFAAGDANLFRYCGGDPVNRTDPSGLVGKSDPPKKKPNEIKSSITIMTGYTPTGTNIPVFRTATEISPGVYGVTDRSTAGSVYSGGFVGFFGLVSGGGPSGGGDGNGGGRANGGYSFVPLDNLGLRVTDLFRGSVTIDGQAYYRSSEAVNALQNAGPGSVSNLTFTGHGSPEGIQVGFRGGFNYTSNGQGGYNFSFDGNLNINSIFNSLSSNATVNFYGCYTASGDSNLTKAFSTMFPGTSVSGYSGDLWTFGRTPIYGDLVTYRNGQINSGGD